MIIFHGKELKMHEKENRDHQQSRIVILQLSWNQQTEEHTEYKIENS